MWKSSPSGELTYLPAERIVVVQLARLEADDPAARVGEREHQPLREVVVSARVREPGAAQLVGGEALLARLLREPGARREAEAELAADLLAEAAALEVRAHRDAGRGLPEVALVERRGLVEHGVEPVAALARLLLLRRGLLVLERDAEPLRQPLDRAGEVEVLGLADERDHVAALAAAEAVVELVGRVDREARRPLLVERAAARVARAGLAQRRAAGDDLDHVGRRDDLSTDDSLIRATRAAQRTTARSGRSCRRRTRGSRPRSRRGRRGGRRCGRSSRGRARAPRARARRGRRART